MKILAVLLALGVSAFAQATSGSVVAGSTADTFHSPTQVCTFLGATATNPPCVTTYNSDAGTLFYGYAGLPFSFAIPVPNGTCTASITAYEPNKTAAGQRVFTITAGVQQRVVDLFALGGVKLPSTIDIPGIAVTDGLLHINFASVIGNALVSKIAYTCVPPPTIGVTCASLTPATGAALVISLKDGSCLPITMLASPSTALGNVQAIWFNSDTSGLITAKGLFGTDATAPVQQ